MRIAFYAPLKPPGHPHPSGDRRMARLLVQALRLGGHTVMLASSFRAYDR
ncbi:MAG: glycosyl transferase, partial [Rhodospirillales bacterium]|nr:glycosyl transferase [Rhodospirillales bacterium]